MFKLSQAGPPAVDSASVRRLERIGDLDARIDPVGVSRPRTRSSTQRPAPGPGRTLHRPVRAAPSPPQSAGEAFGDQPVSLPVQSTPATPVLPGVTYSYRVLATNASGTATAQARSRTRPATGQFTADQRVWELVSPPVKDGAADRTDQTSGRRRSSRPPPTARRLTYIDRRRRSASRKAAAAPKPPSALHPLAHRLERRRHHDARRDAAPAISLGVPRVPPLRPDPRARARPALRAEAEARSPNRPSPRRSRRAKNRKTRSTCAMTCPPGPPKPPRSPRSNPKRANPPDRRPATSGTPPKTANTQGSTAKPRANPATCR